MRKVKRTDWTQFQGKKSEKEENIVKPLEMKRENFDAIWIIWWKVFQWYYAERGDKECERNSGVHLSIQRSRKERKFWVEGVKDDEWNQWSCWFPPSVSIPPSISLFTFIIVIITLSSLPSVLLISIPSLPSYYYDMIFLSLSYPQSPSSAHVTTHASLVIPISSNFILSFRFQRYFHPHPSYPNGKDIGSISLHKKDLFLAEPLIALYH